MIYLLATNNPNKAREIRPMFEAAGLELITLSDLGLIFEAKEEGKTFAMNATQKAEETAAFLRSKAKASDVLPATHEKNVTFPVLPKGSKPDSLFSCDNIAVLADDSGLVIDALDGEPGVDSALYMGRDTPYDIKCKNIIERLATIPDDKRAARFVCMLVCIKPDGSRLMTEGTIEGRIAHAMSGECGFGYDPIFYYPPYGKTLAELSQDEKNIVSHRGQAIQKMIGLIVNEGTGNK